MQRLVTRLGLLASVALLGACNGGANFGSSLPFSTFQAFPAGKVMNEARSTTPTGGAYYTAAYNEEMKHAEYEYGSMMDYKDAMYHARKAMQAAHADPAFGPQPIGERMLPADKVAELTSARERLVAALPNGREAHPEAAGRAVGLFDCWMEQQEENFQPKDIADCRDGFMAALAEIEAKPVSQSMPEVMVLSSDVLFDFDKYAIKPAFKPDLDKIAERLVEDTNLRLLVWGHTDTAGPADYTMRLSVRRANAVAQYLEGKGVDASRLSVEGFGETRLAVPTPDNTPNAQNRRVEIRNR
jgi:OOP family OmpA-OmpF porin